MRPLLLVGLWLGLVALACGCSCTQTCYENAGIVDPRAGTVLIFNKCDGSMYIDYLPGMGGKPKGQTPDQNIPSLQPNDKVES